jgi:hypothetical protein
MSEEEGEVSATSPRRISILRTMTPNSQIEGVEFRFERW